MYDRPDGKSEGICFCRTFGATGFISATSTAGASHPVAFELYDQPSKLPVMDEQMPPMISNCLAEIDDEAVQLLTGQISFEEALNE